MKVALIGAGEFTGARLIESFHLGDGPSLAAIGRTPAELTIAARFAVDLRVADFLEVDSLARSLAGCSVAVHVAPPQADDAKRATTTLCRAAAQAGVRRIVFLSSADVHGLCPPPGTDEKSALSTRHASPALNALVVAERQFLSECRQLGLAAFALRAGYLYGPRVPAFASLAAALQEERTVFAHGEGICNSLYVDNLVAAIRLALKSKVGSGSAYLITDAEPLTWREFLQTAAMELRVSPSAVRVLDADALAGLPAAERETELFARQQCTWQLPTARATRDLGYQPAVPFAEAMRRGCAWWRFAQGDFSAAA